MAPTIPTPSGWTQSVQDAVAAWLELSDPSSVEIISSWRSDQRDGLGKGQFSAAVRLPGNDERWVTGAYHATGAVTVRHVVDPEATR